MERPEKTESGAYFEYYYVGETEEYFDYLETRIAELKSELVEKQKYILELEKENEEFAFRAHQAEDILLLKNELIDDYKKQLKLIQEGR